MPRALRRIALWLVGACVCVPQLHHAFELSRPEREDIAKELTEAQVEAWKTSAPSDARLRAGNPEWDFMARTYVVLALADRALETEDSTKRDELVSTMDRIVEATLEDERAHGASYFMLGYATQSTFVDPEARSIFLDGEIALMLEARETVRPRDDYAEIARARVDAIERTMRRSPSLSAESYPDECWTFCNTTALAATSVFDQVHGGHHEALRRDWVASARAHLVDTRTGILVSSFTRDGQVKDGPEGSSIWMSAANLRFVDDTFARDQYDRARREMGRTAFGFGWAREWPDGDVERPDVDSGPIVPIVGASAGASGLALLGAAAFEDEPYLRSLTASLELAAFPDPRAKAHAGRYLASNRVGDAVVLHSLGHGALLRAVTHAPPPRKHESPKNEEARR